MRNNVTRLVLMLGVFVAICFGSSKALSGSANEEWKQVIDAHGTLIQKGKYKQALPLAERAVVLAESARPNAQADIASSLEVLAYNYQYLGNHVQALRLHQRVLSLHEQIFGAKHENTVTSLNNLANVHSDLGQLSNAMKFRERALGISEDINGPDHLITAEILHGSGMDYTKLGQHEVALKTKLRVLEIREKIYGVNSLKTALSLNNLATTYSYLAQYEKALPLQIRVTDIYRNGLGAEHPRLAMALVNLASSYIALGNYEKSVELQKEALEIHEKTLGPWHPYTAQSLRELGISYQKLKQFENSLEAFRRSLDINERSFGHRHPETARSLVYVGNAYYDIEKYTDALAMQQKALEITKDISESPHPDVARRLHNIALVYDKLGQQDYVRPLFQEALQIFELTLGEGHPDTALSRSHLASELAREGYVDLSIALYKLTINAYQSQRQRIAEIGGAELKSYTDTISTPFQSLSDLLISRGRLAEAQMVLDMLKEDEQFEFIRRSTSANPRKSRIDFNSIESASMDRYRHAYSQLAALVAEDQALQKKAKLGLTEAEKKRLKALVADLVIAKSAFESFLKEMQEVFAAQGPARAVELAETSSTAARNLQSLIKDLGHDSVLLQYYVTEDKVGMLLTTQGVQVARSGNVNARDLNRQIAEFRRLLRDPKSDPLRASQALYQLLVAPVAQDLEQAGARTVMLSLDGALRYLPFGALHDGQKYLVQRWNLPMYTSVTRNKLKDDVAPQWQAAGLGVTKAVRDFAALPAVKIEMGSIVRTVSGGVLPGEVYLDEAFTAQRLKDVSQRQFQVLHVASHFRFSPGTEVNSFLLLGDGQQLTLGDIRTQNYRFDKVDLLTLSACDTGLGGGRDEKGREIEGFGVIAQQQGAKAVLATLWPVADQSTAILMADMYRRRQDDRLTKTEALRQAQLALLANSRYAHPFYWAPFILMGNWK